MTAYTPVRATHQTLVAATADTVTFSNPGQVLKVTNRDATQVIYFRYDGTAAVSAAADTYVVPAGVGNFVTVALTGGAGTAISLISSAGGAYSCETFPAIGSGGGLAGSSSGGGGAVTNAGTFAVQDSQTVVEDAASSNAMPLFPAGTVRRDTAASSAGTTGDNATLNTDATGYLWVRADGVAVPVTDNSGSLTVDNAGTFLVQENGTWVQVDDAAFTPATSKIVMVGLQADETATDSVDEGDGGAARMTLDRKTITTPQPHTQGGLTTAMFTGSDGSTILTNAAQVIKASAGQVYGYYIYNPNSAATFVHFYNTAAASVTVGTTNPLFSLTIPATAAANLSGTMGIAFSNAGFSIATTTTAGGATAPATGLDAIVWYL